MASALPHSKWPGTGCAVATAVLLWVATPPTWAHGPVGARPTPATQPEHAAAMAPTAVQGATHDAQHSAQHSALPAALPDLAARFRVTLTLPGRAPQVQTWHLQRSATLTVWRRGSAEADIWRRDTSGIHLARVLFDDRHVIDYRAGELRALGVDVDWQQLGTLVAEADLPKLSPVAAARAGQPGKVQKLRGTLSGEKVELTWDALARLPLHLARRSPGGRVVFERTALHTQAPADWPSAEEQAADFQRLDAADFGDMDSHPLVRKAQARDERAGWRKPHAH